MGLGDRGLAAGRGDDGGIAGLRQLDALEAQRTYQRGAVLQHYGGLAVLREDVERGAAHADGRKRRRDPVGGLFRMAGDEAERAGGEADRDLLVGMLVVEDGAVEPDRGIGAEREIGAVDHHQPRGAVGAGAYGLVAQQAVADIDLARSGSRDAQHFVLNDGSFADTGGCLRMRARRGQATNRTNANATATQRRKFISVPIDPSRIVPDDARLRCAIDITSAVPSPRMVSGVGIELRSNDWTRKLWSITFTSIDATITGLRAKLVS